MKKMKLVPADVRVKMLRSRLTHRAPESYQPTHQSTQTAPPKVKSTQTEPKTEAAFGIQTDPTQKERGSQTSVLTNKLVQRYLDHVKVVQDLLLQHHFKWSENQLVFREPPGLPLIPVIEHLVSFRLKSTSPSIATIENYIKRSPSAASEGHKLLRRKPFPE